MNNFKLDNDKITLTYLNGTIEIYSQRKIPTYIIGTIYIDYLGERYFLE
jgi:hypothetical protein